METGLTRKIVRVGNSAGVILPREWYGGEARIELVKKPLDLKKDILEILMPHLSSILGIYIVGSYARGEQSPESDVDVIVISYNLRKEINSDKYHISIYPLESIRNTIEKSPIMILPRLLEAKALLNESLLEELRNNEVKKVKFKEFAEDTKRIIKINKELIDMEKAQGYIHSKSIIYSLILRLRALFLARGILNRKVYSKKEFKDWLNKEVKDKEGIKKTYLIYENVKNNKRIGAKIKVEIPLVEKILSLLEKEVKNYD
jgi:predicted nucleotidyltransferase